MKSKRRRRINNIGLTVCSCRNILFHFKFKYIRCHVIGQVSNKITDPPIVNKKFWKFVEKLMENDTKLILEFKRMLSISVEDSSWFEKVPHQCEGSCESVSCFLYWPVAPIYDLTFP